MATKPERPKPAERLFPDDGMVPLLLLRPIIRNAVLWAIKHELEGGPGAGIAYIDASFALHEAQRKALSAAGTK